MYNLSKVSEGGPKMRIAINLLYLIPGECGGTETYGVCLVNALVQLDPTNQYIIFINRESKDIPLVKANNLTKINCNIKAANRPMRYFYEQAILPFLLLKHQVDLVHSLGYVTPLLAPCKNVVTVHDMNYVDVRNDFHWFKRLILSSFCSASARIADRVITISEFSKSAICRCLGVSPTKVTVTHLGPGWLGDPHARMDWEVLRSQYNLPERYIIAFGGGALHKNIPKLIQAYLESEELWNCTLVIMGRLPVDVRLPETTSGDVGPKVQWLGYVPTNHIQPLLSYSAVYVLPSLYEGFGMPILEAQFSGALVVSSNAASLPEIGGEGAIYFNPVSVPAISEAIRAGLRGDASWVAGIRKAAKENLKRFSWEATAHGSLDVYLSILRATSQRQSTPVLK